MTFAEESYAKNKIKILFVLPSLHPGGAERVTSLIAQNIDKTLFESKLLILYSPKNTDYKVEGIQLRFLMKKRSLTAIPEIIKAINTFKPHIVFSSISQLNFLGGCLNRLYRNIKFVGRETSVLSLRKRFDSGKGLNFSQLKPLAYQGLTAIVCQSEDMSNDLQDTLNIKKDKIRIIGNPAYVSGLKREKRRDKSPVQLISVGRLTKVKGYERLFSILSELDFEFHFTLIGDGEDRVKLLDLARDLCITDSFTHIPFTNQVEKYLVKADLFLQSSYVEGFPNALLESCAVGVPAIAFNAPGGTKEIIQDGINGFLVDDAPTFKERIYRAAFKEDWNTDIIINSINQKFNSEIILKKYESFFLEIFEGSFPLKEPVEA